MWLDHIWKVVFETPIFLKPLYFQVFVKPTLVKNSPYVGEFFTRVRRVFY